MNTTIDLDLSNYDLDDILNLFHIPYHFTEDDLKTAKMRMLKTHPDKSGLDPRFFRFYTEAYNTLITIWEFKQKGNTKNTEYNGLVYDNEKKSVLDNWFNENKSLNENKNSFNDWFNEQFTNTHIYNDRDIKGYDEWLRNTEPEEIDTIALTDISKMNKYIDDRKQLLRDRSIVKKHEVQELWNTNIGSATDLSPNAPSNYDSDIFSGLAYQDLQKAHTETMIPITMEDYDNITKFKNVNEFIHFRNAQDVEPLKEQEAMRILKEQNQKEEERSMKIAYNLAKQTEEIRRKNDNFWKGVQLLH